MIPQRVDAWGRVILTETGLLEMFYKGLANGEIIADDTKGVAEYNSWCETFDHPEKKLPIYTSLPETPDEYHARLQSDWLMPEEYKNIDVEEILHSRCTTQNQHDRVDFELSLYMKHQMYDVLRLLLYIVDTLKAKNVFWGVGRGSSVASYCLFLLGVHRIDSLKYDLQFKEFIKN